MGAANELHDQTGRRLGRLPVKSSRKALQFSDFFKFVKLPTATKYWTTRKPFPLQTFGNDQVGCCTRAKQAAWAYRMERLEQKRQITITDAEVMRVYREMSDRLYGGGDNGAYEDDALSEWRKPDLTFRDTAGNPYTIDAFLRINPFNHDEVRAGLALSGSRGLAVCLNLPAAFSSIEPPHDWAIPVGQQLLGAWMPGSWGGHSMLARDWDAIGIWLVHTWGLPDQRITWEAAAVYLDECHMAIDSLNSWKARASDRKMTKALNDIKDAVNGVSSLKIK